MCGLCENTALQVNVRQYDPTRTLTLRNAFVSEMNRRFKRVAKLVTKAVVEEDVFGLNEQSLNVLQDTPGTGAFRFMTDSQKLDLFMVWLRQVEDAVILEMGMDATYGTWTQVPWTNAYIARAFEQGTARAKQELKKFGLGVVLTDVTGLAYINPVSLEKLRMLFTRSFTELKGVTATMDEQISRILAQGLIDGEGPARLARMINSAIIGGGELLGMDISYITKTGKQVSYFMPGRRRAEILARTEIIRAHHVATISEYRNWAIDGVYVLAEWATAKDGRVCPECSAMEGTLWSLDEIEGLIPLHPMCRCVTIPYVNIEKTGAKEFQN